MIKARFCGSSAKQDHFAQHVNIVETQGFVQYVEDE